MCVCVYACICVCLSACVCVCACLCACGGELVGRHSYSTAGWKGKVGRPEGALLINSSAQWGSGSSVD